jgi:Protein of unknown function (DUF3303)
MKFMSTWALTPGTARAAAEKFLSGVTEPEGVTLLGRWHNVDCSGGFVLFESNNPAALHLSSSRWVEFLEIRTVAVIEDGEAGPNLAATFKK